MSEIKPKHLAIQGKVINVEKIGEKTLAQFKAQLKQNGVTLEDAHAERVYKNLRGELTEEQQAAKAAAEAKTAALKAQAEARVEAARKYVEDKLNQTKKGA